MFRNIKKGEVFFLVALFVISLAVRFYDYPNRMVFGPEQAMSLITTGEMIKEKFSLLGEAYIQRTTSTGLFLFHSALFNYTLIPLEIIFRYDPFGITITFTFLNFITGLLLYFLVKKAANSTIAWFSAFLFFLNSKMIHHSLFIWTLNYLPLIGLLSLHQMWKLFKNRKTLLPILLLGILSGIGFGLQYVYSMSAFLIFIFILLVSKRKLFALPLYLLGAAIGDLSMIIFDLKHEFYHLNTLVQYFQDVQAGKISAFYTYYQFLNFWPVFAIIGGMVLAGLFKKNKLIVIITLAGYLFINITSPYAKLTSGKAGTNEISLSNLNTLATTIAKDSPPEKYNIAVLLDFDTRAHPLRYVLTYRHGLKPQDVENYHDLDALYVLSPYDYDYDSPKVWELQTFYPYKMLLLDSPTPNHQLFKLTK